MATRSTIAVEYSDGTIEQIYCHWDGYLDYNGKLLEEYWKDTDKIKSLMALGDLVSLGKVLGEKHNPSNPYRYNSQEYFEYHSKYNDYCKFFGRDKEEEGVSSKNYNSFKEYIDNIYGEEYNYILRTINDNLVWYVSFYKTNGRFVTLSKAIELDDQDDE